MNLERKLSFKVSAKAARLIGRENVANAEGAIVELVKNTYDADANHCFLVFVPRFAEIPAEVQETDLKWLSLYVSDLDALYELEGDTWKLRPHLDQALIERANQSVVDAIDLWIIDNGKGMSTDIIERYWMVIGTNFKEENIFSEDGRVRTGAKGIGRFALDRLGAYCQLRSYRNDDGGTQAIDWKVDWRAFEGPGKILDDVQATLVESSGSINDALVSLADMTRFRKQVEKATKAEPWSTGTAICVSGLRDKWSPKDVQHLHDTMASLVPPAERPPLALYIFDARNPDAYGEVVSGAPSDFDYRLHADVGADGKVQITVARHELRVEALDDALFRRPDMLDQRYQRASFVDPLVYDTNIDVLFPGANPTEREALHKIGPFEFTLLFYKRTLPSKDDTNRYPYRSFEVANRTRWLDKQGGVKIYRDDFIVRPYGEPDGKGFDWLRLGQRVAANPVQASRKGWRANPQNLAGTIKISRATNPGLADQSNREGLIENDVFRAFSALIVRLIKEFEDDRSLILNNLNELFKAKHPAETAKSQAKAVADRIERSSATPSREDAVTLARAYRAQVDEIRDLNSERGMLRALATLGTVLVSFSHEMGQLQSSLENRSQTLERVLKRYITPSMLEGVSDVLNPFEMLKDAERSDRKIKQWFSFALSSVKADKRSRRSIRVQDHLRTMQVAWRDFLEARQITLRVEFVDRADPYIRALEIDLDSIFNNLLLNSVEAFVLRNHGGERQIDIRISQTADQMVIRYSDTGPGVDPSYRTVSEIFNFGATTKTGLDGEGTGIGMWILDSVVKEYGGTAEAFRPSTEWGFKIDISLPTEKGERSA